MTRKEEYQNHIRDVYAKTRPLSKALHDRALKTLPGGDTRTATFFYPFPHFIQYGKGAYLYDVDGNKLLDYQSNYTSLIHGHAHEGTVEAVSRQMEMGSAYAAPFELQVQLAELLVDRFPSIDLIRFTNSGTEANMHVLRIARAYTGKSRIIKTEGGYHGTTDVFEASVDPNLEKAGTLDRIKVLPESRGVSANALKDVLVAPFNDVERTETIIREHHEEVACFIVEPVMGSAGQITPDPEYLKALRQLTEKYGILLIFDEVVTARLSLGGAQQVYGIMPDLTSLGKIIGGGTAIGAFGGRREIMEMYDPREKLMYHSGTFNGNAVSLAAGLAAMEDYGEDMVNYVNALGAYFKEETRQVFRRAGLKLTLSGTGSLYNVLFTDKAVKNYRDVASSHEELNKLLYLTLITKGVFNAERGMFCMSTAMTREDIDFGSDKLLESLVEMRDVIEETAPELVL